MLAKFYFLYRHLGLFDGQLYMPGSGFCVEETFGLLLVSHLHTNVLNCHHVGEMNFTFLYIEIF
jgi:hypothetical protein